MTSILDRHARAGSGPAWSGALTVSAGAGVLAALVGATRTSLAASGVAAAVCVVLLFRRAALSEAERAVWLRWALCAAPTALSVVASWAGAPHLAAVLVMGVFPLAYGASVRWNRYATSLADPHEAINGVASVIAVVAVAELVAQLTHSGPAELPWLPRLLLWGPIASAVIIFTSLAAVIPVAGLARDARAWLLLTAVGLVAVLTAGGFLGLRGAATSALLALAAWCAGRAALLPPGDLQPRPVDATDSTIGGFVILVACTGTLLTGALADNPCSSSWLAATAACLSAVRLVRNVQDIAALATSRQEALTDDLTGIPNRRALLRRADELTASGRPVVLAIIDLDGFKHINDSLGHAAGDQLLRQVAGRLRETLPDTSLLGRLGGDEFAVVAPLPDGDDAPVHLARVGRDLLAALGRPVDISGFLIHGSGSVGLTASSHQDAPDVSELLRQADAAMYEAKATRGTAVVYDPVRHAAHGQLRLVEELRTALEEGQLVLHHQPQVEVATGRTIGVEALIRWEHPTRGLLAPGAFLDLAEYKWKWSQCIVIAYGCLYV